MAGRKTLLVNLQLVKNTEQVRFLTLSLSVRLLNDPKVRNTLQDTYAFNHVCMKSGSKRRKGGGFFLSSFLFQISTFGQLLSRAKKKRCCARSLARWLAGWLAGWLALAANKQENLAANKQENKFFLDLKFDFFPGVLYLGL